MRLIIAASDKTSSLNSSGIEPDLVDGLGSFDKEGAIAQKIYPIDFISQHARERMIGPD